MCFDTIGGVAAAETVMGVDLRAVRNIGIAAHIDAGKTTTTERILYYTHRTHRMGDVDDGTTITDFDVQEQTRGITIYSAAVTCPWRDHTINLIDTPGHVDFTAEVERSLRVLDGMVAVFDAKEGVEAQSETVWRQADKYEVPRLCLVNKMDRLGADFDRAVDSIRDRLHCSPLVIQLPIGVGDTFTGIVDLIGFKAILYDQKERGATFTVREIPDELLPIARKRRHELLEVVCDTSEVLMDAYLGEEPLDAVQLRQAVREATIRRDLVPVLCGSALRYVGVQPMLDAVCDFLPSPLDVPPVKAADARNPELTHEFPCDSSGPLLAMVFKVIANKPVDLCFLRIYSGTLKQNVRLFDPVTGEKVNISRIYRMFAKRREQLDSAQAGDIVAVVGPKGALTGHTLCDRRRPVVLEPIQFPDTVISVSIEPKSSRDREKLLQALTALERQDPTLVVSTNSETGQTLLSGMGELHLEVMVQRLRSEMGVDVAVGRPLVSYRETVAGTGEGTGRFVRQLGGRDHFAVVRLRIGPRPHVAGRSNYEILSEITEGELQPDYARAIEDGISDAAHSGVLGGYPVIDWKVGVLGAEQHDADSSALAFESAARQAFYEAMGAAEPALLEPIMYVEVVTSDEYFGAIMSDLSARKAVIRETRLRGMDRVILADVPLAQMFGYITKLRSLSQGRATSTMTPSHYAAVPAEAMKALVG